MVGPVCRENLCRPDYALARSSQGAAAGGTKGTGRPKRDAAKMDGGATAVSANLGRWDAWRTLPMGWRMTPGKRSRLKAAVCGSAIAAAAILASSPASAATAAPLHFSLGNLDATSAGRAPVWAATYLTPDGEIDALPIEGNVCIRDKSGNDVVVMNGIGADNSYVRTFVKFVDGDPTAIRRDFSDDGAKYEKMLEMDFRKPERRENKVLASIAVDAMTIYSDVCDW